MTFQKQRRVVITGLGVVAPNGIGREAFWHSLNKGMLAVNVGYFSLDGLALPLADQTEADALKLTFGADLQDLTVSVPRTMYGHSFAAAGALDTITALLALDDGMIPPTINCEQRVPHYCLNLVQHEPKPLSNSTALIGGRGLSGANVVLAVKKV
jgi:3-oxoacyl-[acyl-carrier-protein] synthase II